MIDFAIMFLLLFCAFLIIKLKILKSVSSETTAGAIVMACGIFINGAMKNIPILEHNASHLFATSLLLIWIFIAASIIKTLLNKTIYERHLEGSVKSFAVGTWVAGTSVCGIAVFQRLPWLIGFTRFLLFANIALWLFYIYICLRNYGAIFKENLFIKVHGVILIATVSTQSIVVLGNTVYSGTFPSSASRLLISLGIIFYVIGFVLIVKRYCFTAGWNIEDDWTNTNCIIHGAMSITGLASVTSKAVNPNYVLIIWIWIVIWFLIIEIIELIRAYKRIQKYGFKSGVAVYNVTQWSRIFTFGMFYTFTMRFNIKSANFSNSLFLNLQHYILKSGTWLMVCILVIEGTLFFAYQSKKTMDVDGLIGNK